MSCWVVAALAAEVLGISVNQVLERVQSGALGAKNDLGFLLVDVAPHSPRLTAGQLTPARRPPTFRPITQVAPERAVPAWRISVAPATSPESELSDEEELALAVDPDPSGPSKFDFSDWRRSRQATARSRMRPPTYRAA